jgi:N-acetylmuramoyl-L-alanine amidase
LSQFTVMGAAVVAAPTGPTVVLDPEDDLGFANWPNGRVSELTTNLALVEGVRSRLVDACQANVVVTRGTDRFVDRSIRAAVGAAAGPDLSVTLAFNALAGQPWGDESSGGVARGARNLGE